ncbi:MAG: hypothetical protein H7066_06580 [Cytophagaceae bacterium]|nr:hypothetical protein [Gemmatimonadaceae bacterium]
MTTCLRHCGAALIVVLAACGSGDQGTTPPPPPPSGLSLDVVGGNQQRGLTARPLADSLTVRVHTSGTPAAGATVTWATSSGQLSASSSTTDANGLARVQWIPGTGEVAATAAVGALPAATFNATTRVGGSCMLKPAPAIQRFSLGPTDYTLSLRATNALRVAVLFVDFPDAGATETPASLVNSVVTPGLQLMSEMSYGKVRITPVAFPTWYRMPKAITTYTWTTFAGQRDYLLDVLSVTDAAIDFSTFDALYVFTPPNGSKPISPTFNGGTTANVVADGRNFGNAVTFGIDSRQYGPAVLAHETGHMLGLVDLYAFQPSGGTFSGHTFKFVGSWTLMSNIFRPSHYLTWEKRKLGFIDESQVDCLDAPGGVEAVLTPNHAIGGRKMVIVTLDASSAIVIEARARQGLDANLCDEGVLVYLVDAGTAPGSGPAVVLGSRTTTTGAAFTQCGPWADGTFGVGPGAVSSWTHAASGVSISVIGVEAGGAHRIRVKR